MAAHEALSNIQFQYDSPESLGSRLTHRVRAMRGEEKVGQMSWDRKQLVNIEVNEQRQGVGTALWHEGHRLAAENQRIPQPKHSAYRTKAGDAWARSVGGRLPRKK